MSTTPQWLPNYWGTLPPNMSNLKKITSLSGNGNFLTAVPGVVPGQSDGTANLTMSQSYQAPYQDWGIISDEMYNGVRFNNLMFNNFLINNNPQCLVQDSGLFYVNPCDKRDTLVYSNGAFGQQSPINAKGQLFYNDSGIGGRSGVICYNQEKGLYPVDWESDLPNLSPLGEGFNDCKWIDEDTAVNCCSFGPTDNMCGDTNSSYNLNNPANTCNILMTNYCMNEWITSDTYNPTSNCAEYLDAFKNSPDGSQLVQTVLSNYINDNAVSTQTKYHKPDGTPIIDYIPERDKNNGFYKNILPVICNAVPSSCDTILDYYCASHTRDEVQSDETLRRICGCHLSVGNGVIPPKPVTLKYGVVNPPQKESQYPYPISQSCDPLCNIGSPIQRGEIITVEGKREVIAQQCDETICIIDNLNIDNVLSGGGTWITQNCGGPGHKSACYIDKESIEKIDSQGNVHINQDCGVCFEFDSNNPSNTNQIPCPGPPGPEPGPSIKNFFEKYKDILIIIGVIIGLILLIIVIYLIFKSRKTAPDVEFNLQDYWSSYE